MSPAFTRGFAALTLFAITLIRVTSASAQGMSGMTSTMDMDRQIRVFGIAELLEYVPNGRGSIRADALAWIGGDYNRIYFRLDGDKALQTSGGETEVDIAYGRLVTPVWTALAGARVEVRGLGSAQRSTRTLLALGFEGLSTYWFVVEPALYVSKTGQVSGRFATAMDLLFTQRLILQPRLETHFAVQQVAALGIGSGINDIELGARMRYEFRREFAPYIGLRWFRRTGGTAGLARASGETVGEAGLVAGVRMWR